MDTHRRPCQEEKLWFAHRPPYNRTKKTSPCTRLGTEQTAKLPNRRTYPSGLELGTTQRGDLLPVLRNERRERPFAYDVSQAAQCSEQTHVRHVGIWLRPSARVRRVRVQPFQRMVGIAGGDHFSNQEVTLQVEKIVSGSSLRIRPSLLVSYCANGNRTRIALSDMVRSRRN